MESVPRYFVYGEPTRLLTPGFVHIELISDRKSLHKGHVEAHSHPNICQLTCWIRGGGTYTIEENDWNFSAPAIAWLPSGVVHGFEVSQNSDAIVLSIADDALPAIRPAAAGFATIKDRNSSWRELTLLLAMLQRQHTSGVHDALLALTAATLAFASRLVESAPTGRSRALAVRLKTLVDERFREGLKIEAYATALNSTYHLIDKAARNSFGVSVKELIQQRRMLEARRLLKFTIRSADEIAFELGYNDPAYFNRAFKKHAGLSPIAWRKKQEASS